MAISTEARQPIVSVIIPTYNRAHSLEKAVRSVLDQTFRDFELIIVDDCSSDDTADVANGFHDTRVRYHRLAQNTGSGTIPENIGFDLARGRYLATLDDDYMWEEDKLSRQVNFLEDNPDHVLVGTNRVAWDETGREAGRTSFPLEDQEIRNVLLRQSCFSHGAVLFRKAAVAASGGHEWRSDRIYSQDYERWLKLGTVGKMANLSDYLVGFTTLEGVSSGHRLRWCLVKLQIAKRYRQYYPHGNRALALRHLDLVNVTVHVVSDIPPLRGLKKTLQRRWPAGWRVMTVAHGAMLRALSAGIVMASSLPARVRHRSGSAR